MRGQKRHHNTTFLSMKAEYSRYIEVRMDDRQSLPIGIVNLPHGYPNCRERRPWRSTFARNRPTAQRPFPTELGGTETVPYSRKSLSSQCLTPTRVEFQILNPLSSNLQSRIVSEMCCNLATLRLSLIRHQRSQNLCEPSAVCSLWFHPIAYPKLFQTRSVVGLIKCKWHNQLRNTRS